MTIAHWYADDALGSFDDTYDNDWAPMVYVSKTDGDVLRAEVQTAMATEEPNEATMVCDTDVNLADDGGTAYNVIDTLPGKNRGQAIVHLGAHGRALPRRHGRHRRAGQHDHHRQGDAHQRSPAQLRHRLPRHRR